MVNVCPVMGKLDSIRTRMSKILDLTFLPLHGFPCFDRCPISISKITGLRNLLKHTLKKKKIYLTFCAHSSIRDQTPDPQAHWTIRSKSDKCKTWK